MTLGSVRVCRLCSKAPIRQSTGAISGPSEGHNWCLQETQTKPEGQIHFFPIIFDGKQLYDVMVERCGPSQTSGPKN